MLKTLGQKGKEQINEEEAKTATTIHKIVGRIRGGSLVDIKEGGGRRPDLILAACPPRHASMGASEINARGGKSGQIKEEGKEAGRDILKSATDAKGICQNVQRVGA